MDSQITKSSSNDMNRTLKIFLRCAGGIAIAAMASKRHADAGLDLVARRGRPKAQNVNEIQIVNG